MSELYADEYDSLGPAGGGGLVSDGLRRTAGAVLFLALIGGLGLWAYRLGTRDAAEVPIIKAMEGPARIAPHDPGGLRAAHQGLEVNAVLAALPAPKPEAGLAAAPPPNALADEDAAQGELVVVAPMTLPEDIGGDLRMPLPDDGPADGSAAEAPSSSDPAALVAAVVAGVALPTDAALTDAALTDAVQQAEPAALAGPRPLRRPATLVRASASAPAAASATPASPPAVREVASVSSGSRLVQLGAFDSEGIARQAWNILAKRHADLLGAKSLYVERTTANARVFYRLRVAGFETPEQTRQMCEALRARGVDCIPVTLQ